MEANLDASDGPVSSEEHSKGLFGDVLGEVGDVDVGREGVAGVVGAAQSGSAVLLG